MTTYHYRTGDQAPHLVAVERHGNGWRVVVDGRAHDVEARAADGGRLELTIDGTHRSAHVATDGKKRWVATSSRTWLLERVDSTQKRRSGSTSDSGHDVLESTMPGQVRDVLVKPGDTVTAGQTLVLLEAMKMELQVKAPHAGKIAAVLVTVGQTVERGQRLVDVEGNA